jgi:hypothetical protein
MQKGGNYLQVLPGDKLPPYETGSVSDNLGADVPTNIRVDEARSSAPPLTCAGLFQLDQACG